jgi:hypothetical protein
MSRRKQNLRKWESPRSETHPWSLHLFSFSCLPTYPSTLPLPSKRLNKRDSECQRNKRVIYQPACGGLEVTLNSSSCTPQRLSTPPYLCCARRVEIFTPCLLIAKSSDIDPTQRIVPIVKTRSLQFCRKKRVIQLTFSQNEG